MFKGGKVNVFMVGIRKTKSINQQTFHTMLALTMTTPQLLPVVFPHFPTSFLFILPLPIKGTLGK